MTANSSIMPHPSWTTGGWIWAAAGPLSFPLGVGALVVAPATFRAIDAWFFSVLAAVSTIAALALLVGLLTVFGIRGALVTATLASTISLLLSAFVVLSGTLGTAWAVAAWGVAMLMTSGYSLVGVAAEWRRRRAARAGPRQRERTLRVFFSYRRKQDRDSTDRICEHVKNAFPKARVFRDIEGIPLGVDFRTAIDLAIADSEVLLAIIGPEWTLCRDARGDRRLHDPEDFVRIEVESALGRVPVIPLLVNGAAMPKADDLPASLENLAYRNALSVRPDPDFAADMARLFAALDATPVTQGLSDSERAALFGPPALT